MTASGGGVLIIGGALIVARHDRVLRRRRRAPVPGADPAPQRHRRSGVLRRCRHDDHRPRARAPAGRGGQLLVRRRVRRASRSGPLSGRPSSATTASSRRGRCRRRWRCSRPCWARSRSRQPGGSQPRLRRKLLHRAALAPGTVLFLGLIGLAGFTAFVPLYVRELGLGGADGSFLLYGGLILCVRIFGARLPDVLGGRVAATIALSCGAVGLTVMAGWRSVAGLVAGTAVFAAGMSLAVPGADAARAHRRARATSAARSSGRSAASSTSRRASAR